MNIQYTMLEKIRTQLILYIFCVIFTQRKEEVFNEKQDY